MTAAAGVIVAVPRARSGREQRASSSAGMHLELPSVGSLHDDLDDEMLSEFPPSGDSWSMVPFESTAAVVASLPSPNSEG